MVVLAQGDDAEVAPLREKIIELRRAMFDALQTEVSKRWTFEETVSVCVLTWHYFQSGASWKHLVEYKTCVIELATHTTFSDIAWIWMYRNISSSFVL